MKKLIFAALMSLVVMTGVAFGGETRELSNGQAPPAVRAEHRRMRHMRHRRHMRHMRRRMRREMRHGA